LFRTAVFIMTLIALVSFAALWITAISLAGPPPPAFLKDLYFRFLLFLIAAFLQLSIIYLLSLIATDLRKHCWNPTNAFIFMALLILFHISVVISGFTSFFIPSRPTSSTLSQVCLSNFMVLLMVMAFIYAFSVEFLRISHGEALTSAFITGFVFTGAWTFFQFWWFAFRFSDMMVFYTTAVAVIFVAMAICFAYWYHHRHLEWLERGEDAPPEGLIRTGVLFILGISAGLIVGFIGAVLISTSI